MPCRRLWVPLTHISEQPILFCHPLSLRIRPSALSWRTRSSRRIGPSCPYVRGVSGPRHLPSSYMLAVSTYVFLFDFLTALASTTASYMGMAWSWGPSYQRPLERFLSACSGARETQTCIVCSHPFPALRV